MYKIGNYITKAEKGVANGVATLDAGSKLPVSQLPTSAMEYKGVWDASTNTPTLASGTGTNGDYYLVSVDGTTTLDGVTDWQIGDAVLFNGGLNIWQKVGKISEVDTSIVSINGKKDSAGTIAKGLPVYLVGFDSDLHTVEIADCNNASAMPVIGFTGEPFNNTDSKPIITYGKLEGIDTTSTVSTLNPNGETWAVNDVLYMSTTPGGLTKTRPTGATSLIQRIAKILKVDASGGQIFIFNTARTAGLPNLTTDNVWVGDVNGYPQIVNKSTLGGNTIYTADDTIGSGRELTLTDTVRFKNGSFEIQGAGTSTGSTLALYDNDTTPYKRFEILDNGQFRLDSSNAVVTTPVLIEMRPIGGTGTKPYFKIKAYGEVEILGGLSNLFNVQNTLGAKQFEVLNGLTKINGSSQINSSFFQVVTNTQKMSFNAGSGGALHHEIMTNGGGGAIKTRFNIPGGGYQFIVGASAIIGTEKISLQGDTLVDGSLDMNNNRILNSVVNPSVQETTSTATFTINADEQTDGVLTAMAANTTIASPTGTPVQSQSLIFRFKDDGTPRTLTWNAIFRAIGITLPTTTTANKLLYVGCKYNSTDTKWDVISVQEEA